MTEHKHHYFWKRGTIYFTSESPNKMPESDGSMMYWMSYLCGGSADWPVYIEISKDEFFGVKEGRITAHSVMQKHQGQETGYTEARKIAQKYGLDAAMKRHYLTDSDHTP